MKIQRNDFTPSGKPGLGAPKRSEGGSAVFVFISLMAIMMILVAANTDALSHLHQDIKLLQRRQIERLNASQTNTNAVVESPATLESK